MRRAIEAAFRHPPPYFNLPLITSIIPERANGIAAPAQLSLPTFTRNLAAVATDFSGLLKLLPANAPQMQGTRIVQNLIDVSEDISGWTLQANVVRTQISGSLYSLDFSASANNQGAYTVAPASLIVGHSYRWTVEMYLPATSGDGSVQLYDPNGASFGPESVTLTIGAKRITSSIFVANNVSNGLWFRKLAGGATLFYVRHIQVEDVTGQTNQNPSEYVSVGVLSAPYHGLGVDGIAAFSTTNGNSVASNIVTEAAGVPINSALAAAAGGVTAGVVDASGPLGYLAESAATQIIAATADIRDMTTANWTAGATMTVARTSVGADGAANSANRLTAGAVAATNTLTYLVTAAASSRTYSVLMKRITGTGPVRLTQLAANSDISASLINGSWVRVAFTESQLNATIGVQIDTNLDAVDVDFNSFVAGGVATSPIATGGATRPIDVDQYVSAGNIAATMSGTMQVTPSTALGSTVTFHFGTYVDADNYTAVLSDGTNLIARKRIAGTSHDATIAWTRTVGTVAKIGWTFDSVTGSQIYLNGVAGTVDATTTAAQIGAAFQIGSDGNGANADNCAHRFLNLHPTSLTPSRMTALTT